MAALAAIAGCVDAFGYLKLGHVFVSHATGNTAGLAISLVRSDVYTAWLRGVPIVAFFAGALLASVLLHVAGRVLLLAVELALLTLFVLLAIGGPGATPPPTFSWVVMTCTLAATMGLQNAALVHGGTRGMHTTHVTGPATDLAHELVRLAIRRRASSRLPRLAARWLGFALGGAAGAALFEVAPSAGLLVPAAAVGVLLGLEARRPGRRG